MKKLISLILLFFIQNVYASEDMLWLGVETNDKYERTKLINAGFTIDTFVSDTSFGFVHKSLVPSIKKTGLKIKKQMPMSAFGNLDFPDADSAFHNYEEQFEFIANLESNYPNIVKVFSIGNSLEGRPIKVIRFTASKLANPWDQDDKPGIVFMGSHHAREHLSVEIPLLLAEMLASKYGNDDQITRLVDTRDIFIILNVNPDGSEYDIETGSYKMWRKNRRDNDGNRCAGVDLNRNYAFKWGTGGSSSSPCSDTFMGPEPFSEPETLAVKNFVESRPNLNVLLSFHTYSELILYPWGHKYDSIEDPTAFQTHKTMAETMARWNKYTPQQSSDLYIASGDTTDWSYGQLGITSFTFELSPSRWGGGGFYPGAGAIASTFQANIRPLLYMIDLADDPTRSIRAPETTMFYGQK